MNKLSKMAIIAVSGLLFLTGCSEANRVSENLSLVVEDVEVPNVSKYKYEINYNPKMWVPVKLKNVD